ncbi:hypothetical protein T484DRAFT_1855579 [Baffinella frigidus]|nr:hypothetical protein T484DRAFT_1855579 [Cryptophyta sp. CCMP2293]
MVNLTDVHSSNVASDDEPAGAPPSWELHRVGNLAGHTSRVFCTAFSPREPWVVATASEDGTVRVWNAAQQRLDPP